MLRSMAAGQPWQWTNNVGGGDFFRLFDPEHLLGDTPVARLIAPADVW